MSVLMWALADRGGVIAHPARVGPLRADTRGLRDGSRSPLGLGGAAGERARGQRPEGQQEYERDYRSAAGMRVGSAGATERAWFCRRR